MHLSKKSNDVREADGLITYKQIKSMSRSALKTGCSSGSFLKAWRERTPCMNIIFKDFHYIYLFNKFIVCVMCVCTYTCMFGGH